VLLEVQRRGDSGSARVRGDQAVKVAQQGGVGLGQRLATTAGTTLPIDRDRLRLEQFGLAFEDGGAGNAGGLGNHGDTTAANRRGLTRRPKSAALLRQMRSQAFVPLSHRLQQGFSLRFPHIPILRLTVKSA
jgi:hypothetical protein